MLLLAALALLVWLAVTGILSLSSHVLIAIATVAVVVIMIRKV